MNEDEFPETDVNDRKLIKGVKNSMNKMVRVAILVGVLIGTFSPMMFDETNSSQSTFIMYPVVTFLVGILSFILVKKVWVGPIVTLMGGFISAMVFSNLSPWMWVIAYTFVSLLGSLIGAGIEKIKYKKIKTTLKAVIVIVGVLIAIISFVTFSFLQGMSSDKSEEKKVIAQAEKYLEKEDPNGNYKIYDVLYDNMGNFDQFEYAAKVRNLDDGEEFLIFYNEQTKQMEDSRKYPDEFK